MLGKKIFKSIKAVKLVAALFAAAVSVLLLTSFANAGSAVTQQAYILGIDPSARTLTVQLFETDISSDIRHKGEIELSFNDVSKVTLCNESKSFDDLKAGDTVTLTYHETMSGYFADSIDFAAARGMMC